jgi:cobalt-zinc-cadmium efflux system protein
VLATAAGVVVNIAAAWCMSRANRSSLNVQGAYQHILNDLFAFIATLIADLVMVFTGFTRAYAIASLIVVALMVFAGVRLVRDSSRILLEAAPSDVDVDAIGAELAAISAVTEIHDLHPWQITSGQTALSAHVIVADHADCRRVDGPGAVHRFAECSDGATAGASVRSALCAATPDTYTRGGCPWVWISGVTGCRALSAADSKMVSE